MGVHWRPQRQLDRPVPEPAVRPWRFWVRSDQSIRPTDPGNDQLLPGDLRRSAQTDSVIVTSDTKTILGVVTTLVHDKVYTNGELTEDT